MESIGESKGRQSNRNRNKRADVCIVYSMGVKQINNSNPVGVDIRRWWWEVSMCCGCAVGCSSSMASQPGQQSRAEQRITKPLHVTSTIISHACCQLLRYSHVRYPPKSLRPSRAPVLPRKAPNQKSDPRSIDLDIWIWKLCPFRLLLAFSTAARHHHFLTQKENHSPPPA